MEGPSEDGKATTANIIELSMQQHHEVGIGDQSEKKRIRAPVSIQDPYYSSRPFCALHDGSCSLHVIGEFAEERFGRDGARPHESGVLVDASAISVNSWSPPEGLSTGWDA